VVEIASLSVGDSVELWEDLGFVVEHGAAWIASIRHALGAAGKGVGAWRLRGAETLSELPTETGPAPDPGPTAQHPNGVIGLDHVVIATPDVRRTIDAFEAAGIGLRRTRDAGSPERPMTQAFFRLGGTIAEVVGTPIDPRSGPARFFGLAFTVSDLETTARVLGERLRPAKDAVQPGRQIATLDRAAGSTVAMAFMTAHHPRLGEEPATRSE
jgi:hypothetical protein